MKIRMICFSVSAALLWSVQAFAGDTVCYKFKVPDSPEMAATLTGEHMEKWCYQRMSSPVGAYFVFNADEEKVRPELSFVVEADGTMTHGSLKAGKISVHKVNSKVFNPFPVPARPPHSVIATGDLFESRLAGSAQNVLRQLHDEAQPTAMMAIEEGTFTEAVADSELPWRGYWWPYRNAPLYGTSSAPLGKYDRFVQARTGSNPGARSWERSRHYFKGIWWEGHCNGWAASAILREQPTKSKFDSRSGVTFSIADQKGILAEKDYCANVAFFGKRYRGSGDIRDIYPHVLHRVLTYYIGQLGKPVVADYHRDSTVDNHIISGYKMTVVKTSATQYTVTMAATFHKYDGTRSNPPGIAPRYTRTYKYRLNTDSAGNVTGGTWISTNPDFLWVPLSPTSCGSNNPRVTESNVSQILSLPAASE